MDDMKAEALRQVTKKTCYQENYLEMCQLSEKFNSEIMMEKCSQYVLQPNQYNRVTVNWEEIHKLPNLSINIMKLSQELVSAQSNKHAINKRVGCYPHM